MLTHYFIAALFLATFVWAGSALNNPITGIKAQLSNNRTGPGYYWDTWEVVVDFAFNKYSLEDIRGGDFFGFTLAGKQLNPRGPKDKVPVDYDFYIVNYDGRRLFHVTTTSDSYNFRATATSVFDNPSMEVLELSGQLTVEFLVKPNSPVGLSDVSIGPWSSSINLEDPDMADADAGACWWNIDSYQPANNGNSQKICAQQGLPYPPSGYGRAYLKTIIHPMYTKVVTGLTAGSETLVDDRNIPYERVTTTPASTITVAGYETGLEFFESVGSIFERTTETPAYTTTVEGLKAGSEFLTNSEHVLYEQVTAIPAFTSTIAGYEAGSQLLE